MSTRKTIPTPQVRLRRLRRLPALRNLLSEYRLAPEDLVCPLFIKEGEGIRQPIASMPGQYQLSIDQLDGEIQSILSLGIPAVILFGIPQHKDSTGSHALSSKGVIQEAIVRIKSLAPELLVIADLCLCEYTDHGHCGVLSDSGELKTVDNDKTLALLGEQAVSLAKAGADIVAPSGMMDGMVKAIRYALDEASFSEIAILSYAVKYASAFYGPFRDAAEGAPQFGDRSTYQMDPANASVALREAELDVQEGADMLMVKPAQTYLDIVYRVKQQFPALPLGAYHVSGEFAMLKAAAEKGWLHEETAMMESLLAIKRAGADFIITYYAKEAAAHLQQRDV